MISALQEVIHMLSWLKWAWFSVVIIIGLFLKHIFKVFLIASIAYAITEYYYPELPDLQTAWDWLGTLNNVQIQVVVVLTMFFGFLFNYASNVATERQKQLLDIKIKLAENTTLLTQKMCQTTITADLVCTDILNLYQRLSEAETPEEKEWWISYTYTNYCERQPVLRSCQELQNQFHALSSMHSSIYFQIGIDDKIKCIKEIYNEFVMAALPLIERKDYLSDRNIFEFHVQSLFERGIADISEIAQAANLQIGGLSGNITTKLIAEFQSPTFRFAKILLFSPRKAVEFICLDNAPCPAKNFKIFRENSEREIAERRKQQAQK